VRGPRPDSVRRPSAWPVHPRVCGDHSSPDAATVADDGSSPRVRGPLQESPRSPARCPVHPRVCGNHAVASTRMVSDTGSSPRVRGPRGGE